MKVLLITGKLAEDTVKHYSAESNIETEVLSLKIAVAAFLTPQTIADELRNRRLEGFNMILVPGLVRGDTTIISRATGIPTFKGPRYAADLPGVLDLLCEVQLSTTIPACDLLREELQERALKEIEKIEQNRAELLKKPGNMLIGNLAVGKDFPMRVLAEIVDASLMDKTTIQQTAKRFAKIGADLIDVGMIAGESQPEKAKKMIGWVKAVVDVPVSIDTLDPAEIKAAIEAGAQLILSGDAGNIEEIAPYAQDVAVVIIPTNQKQGYFPKKAAERVQYIEGIISKANRLGIKRCLADLIVEPGDILESFIAFKEFMLRNPDVPLFVGISNVTELFDADSVGLNALLARLSSEVNGNMLLATEKSTKAKGTVAEEVVAAKMMFLAKNRGSVPKDLGIDLLVLKDKRTLEETYDRSIETRTNVIQAEGKEEKLSLDSAGVFKINLDRNKNNIVVLHFTSVNSVEPANIVRGKTADDIYSKVIAMGLISRLDHAAYLGNELAKAEIALHTGKQYVQDKELFNK